MTTYAEILVAALNLPPHERGELAETLFKSVTGDAETGPSPQLSEAWQFELSRRSAEIDAGTARYVTYDQMRERARRAAGHDE
jgi:putative addiction module component (TIGR02574 family)